MGWKKPYNLPDWWKALTCRLRLAGRSVCRKSFRTRFHLLLLGLLLMSLGAAGCMTASLGSDPVTAFTQGLSRSFRVSYGTAATLFNLVNFLIVLCINRSYIHFGTVLSVLLTGLFCDGFLYGLSLLHLADSPVPVRAAVLLAGTVLVAVGLGLYQAAGLGISPGDALNQIAAGALPLSLGTVRVSYDLLLTAGALWLGGVIHIGTLAGIVLTGPVMSRTFRWACDRFRHL